MNSFFIRNISLICFAFLLIQYSILAQNDEIAKTTKVLDLVMLQVELDLAANNGQPDIIEIGEGVFDLSLLEQNLSYYPLPKPKVANEEQYPLTIVGAGVGKTIFDAGKKSRRLQISTSQLKDDIGANITVKGITFRNGGSGSDEPGLSIMTKGSTIEVRDCEFYGTNGSHGSTLIASTGTKEGSGSIRIFSCIFDSLRRTVKLTNFRASTFVEKSRFTNFRNYPALEIGNNLGFSYVSKCKFINNHSKRDAPLNAFALSGGAIEINKCEFENNSGTVSGAVRVAGREAKVKIIKNTFRGNRGSNGSGSTLITNDGSGKIYVDRNLFKENFGSNQGGGLSILTGGNKIAGIVDSKGSIGLYNNIFSKNRTPGDGGGVYIETWEGIVEIINNTLLENTTSTAPNRNAGAGLHLMTISNDATAVIYNNIFWKNKCKDKAGIDLLIDNDPDASAAGWLLEPDGIGANVIVSNNIVGKGSIKIANTVDVKNQLNVDPKLNENFKLNSNSPAIDAGTKWTHGIFGAKDYTGKDRVVDGNGDGKAVVDIGAIEYRKK